MASLSSIPSTCPVHCWLHHPTLHRIQSIYQACLLKFPSPSSTNNCHGSISIDCPPRSLDFVGVIELLPISENRFAPFWIGYYCSWLPLRRRRAGSVASNGAGSCFGLSSPSILPEHRHPFRGIH